MMDQNRFILNPFLLLVPLVLTTIALYFTTVRSFINVWTDANNPSYSHGLLLLLVCLFFIFRLWVSNRHNLRLQPSIIGIVGTALISFIWFISSIGNIQFVQQLSLLLIIYLLFVSLLGLRHSNIFLFPLTIIIFAIPIWDFLNIYLRHIATISVELLLNMTGILSIAEGFMIQIPAGKFLIDSGCSGLGQLVAALAVGFIYIFMHPMQWAMRFFLITLAIIVALITNILRIYIVVLSGQITNMQHYFVTVDHVKLGWVIFAIGIFIYLVLANRLNQSMPGLPKKSNPLHANQSLLNEAIDISLIRFYMIIFMMIMALSIGPFLIYLYHGPKIEDNTTSYILPEYIGNWYKTTNVDNKKFISPKFIGADVQYKGTYKREDESIIEVYIFSYYWQQQGKEAVNDLNETFKHSLWQTKSRDKKEFIGLNKPMNVETTIIESKDGRQKLVWQWYSIIGVQTGNRIIAKLLNIWGILIHRPEISVFVIATDIDRSFEDTSQFLQYFSIQMLEKLDMAT